jgi:hypothetical protein
MARFDDNMPKQKTIGIRQPDLLILIDMLSALWRSIHLAKLPLSMPKKATIINFLVVELKKTKIIIMPPSAKSMKTGAAISLRGSGCIATTEEFRNDLHQISYCYIADVLDTSGNPSLTEEEHIDGLSHRWMPVNEALETMTLAEPTSEIGRYIQEGDVYLLAEAKRALEDGSGLESWNGNWRLM